MTWPEYIHAVLETLHGQPGCIQAAELLLEFGRELHDNRMAFDETKTAASAAQPE